MAASATPSDPIAAVVAAARRHLDGEQAAGAERFLRAYYADVAPEDIDSRTPEEKRIFGGLGRCSVGLSWPTFFRPTISVQKRFGGSAGDPTFAQLLTSPQVWGQYADAFA